MDHERSGCARLVSETVPAPASPMTEPGRVKINQKKWVNTAWKPGPGPLSRAVTGGFLTNQPSAILFHGAGALAS